MRMPRLRGSRSSRPVAAMTSERSLPSVAVVASGSSSTMTDALPPPAAPTAGA